MKTLSFLIKTHLHLALSNALLIHCVMIVFFEEYRWPLTLFLFGIFGFVYSLNSLKDKEEDEINSPERLDLFKEYGKVLMFGYLSTTIIATIFLGTNLNTLIAIAASFLIGILYSLPLLPWFKDGKVKFYKFKEIIIFKNLITCIPHALYTIFLPFIYFEISPDLNIWMIAWTFFSVSIVSAILCDLRDIKGDIEAGIKTVPTQLGSRKTIALCYILIAVPLIVSLCLSTLNMISYEALLVILCISIGQFIFLIYQNHIKKEFYGFGSEIFIYISAISLLIF